MCRLRQSSLMNKDMYTTALHTVICNSKKTTYSSTREWLNILTEYSILCSSKMEKAMAPHSSTLAWKIPWMEEPGRRQSMGSHRVGHD